MPKSNTLRRIFTRLSDDLRNNISGPDLAQELEVTNHLVMIIALIPAIR